MKKDAPIKKLYRLIDEIAESYAVLIGIIVFCIFFILVTIISLLCGDHSKPAFWDNLCVEAHGMLLDILVFGVLILFLNKLVGKRIEKRTENQRYLDEIDDFRGWESKEAAYRIAGNLKRLKRNGYKGEIDLSNCYLGCLNLRKEGLLEYFSKYLIGINLAKANLLGANLGGARLRGAKLQKANLQNADLRNVRNLTLEQLSKAKSLYKTKLDPELLEQVKEKYPHLLERPVEERKRFSRSHKGEGTNA